MLNLKIVKFKESPNHLFYFKDDKCIFKQYLKSDWFGVNYNLIWSVFEPKFNYNYQEISDLIKRIVEQVYKLSEVTPSILIKRETHVLEQDYKLSMITSKL